MPFYPPTLSCPESPNPYKAGKIIPYLILFIGKYCSKLEYLKKSYLTGCTGFDGSTASDIRFTKGGNRK